MQQQQRHILLLTDYHSNQIMSSDILVWIICDFVHLHSIFFSVKKHKQIGAKFTPIFHTFSLIDALTQAHCDKCKLINRTLIEVWSDLAGYCRGPEPF